MSFPLHQAGLAAILVETVLYGIGMTMGAVTSLALMRVWVEGGTVNKRLLLVLLLMLVLSTAHVFISFVRVFEAFIKKIHNGPDGALDYFDNLSQPLFVAKNVILVLQTTLGDCVHTWRCYVIFNRNVKVILAPVLILSAGLISGCFVLESTTHVPSLNSAAFNLCSRWIKAYDVCMMSTSVYCALAITWKIYRSGHFFTSQSSLFPVVVVIVEAGALYTSSLVAFLVTDLTGSNGQFVVMDLITPLVPILFCLIILQLQFHQFVKYSHERAGSSGAQVQPTISTRLSWEAVRDLLKLRREPSNNLGVSAFQMRPLAIQISTQAEVHSSGDDSSEVRKKALAEEIS
ncbi:hypothetical protein EVG20_g8995 [Dentipellis fragilis]|uniref:Uncharacterized protein n=1 Tax=Dentipellis fragilis TaxID=205917 RepID=A0A4Y9Y1D8_9AGAM|nr:hypothetical protein EVG20_g8995 [Dentipellis fragilis]